MAQAQAKSYQKPRTIAELQEFCRERNMPLERMRFFIGADTPEPMAFGICRRADGNFLVYKNKADGTRSVRYLGPDEAYAVNEIYEKLKSETQMRREGYAPGRWNREEEDGADSVEDNIDRSDADKRLSAPRSSGKGIGALVAAVLIAFGLYRVNLIPDNGYYHYNNSDYYYYSGDWYTYDDGYGWQYVEDVDEDLTENYGDYYTSEYYYGDESYPDFTDSDYWEYYYSYDDDYDWDWDYDSDSGYDWDDWDYSDTDWDSDW